MANQPKKEGIEEKDSILIVEDSPPNRKILAHLLEKIGFNVVACENGAQAWEKLEKNEINKLVAVISDIMMPKMNGLQLLKNVREHDKYKEIPFVLVTAVSEKEYIVQARDLKVNGYILKPVTFTRVTNKLRELFPSRIFPNVAA